MAGIVEQQPHQHVVGLVALDGPVGPLGEGFLSHCLKQRATHDRRLLARQDLILVFDFADIEAIAQNVIQSATAASNSARSMIGGCPPGRISFLYLTSPI
jgi:hypothetical protein